MAGAERRIGVVGGTSFGHPPDFARGLARTVRTFTVRTGSGESPPIHELRVHDGDTNVSLYYVRMHGEEARSRDEPDGWEFVKTWAALHELGVTHAFGGATCGGVSSEMKPGDLVVSDDFIVLSTQRPQDVLKATGIRRPQHFPRFDVPFCPDLRRLLTEEAGAQAELRVHERGVLYQSDPGRFETPAEIRFVARAGGDVVSLNAATEAIYARQLGMHFALLNSVANPAVGLGGFVFRDMQDAVGRIAAAAVPIVLRAIARVPALEHTCGESCTGETYTGSYTAGPASDRGD